MTHEETLLGIVFEYIDSEPPLTGYKLFFIVARPSRTFINIASGGELTLDDFYEEKVTCDTDSTCFSSDEDE